MDDQQWHWQQFGTAWKGVGIYHITLVVSSREPLLGTLVIPDNDPKEAKVDLSPFGEQVKACVETIPIRYSKIRILQLRMMPDHVHFILYVTQAMDVSIKMVVRGLWQGAKKIGRDYSMSINPNTIWDNRHCSIRNNQQHPNPVFTEMPFIRPLSRHGQLDAMMQYLKMNPQRLATKRLMPGYFHVQRGIAIAGHSYDSIGNIALLQAERYMPVHVRRTMVEDAEHGNALPLRTYMDSCLAVAREGVVMVSPFISPQEKDILAMLLKEQRPVIYLADNGFGDYYKPSALLFDAVAAGRLLILSPWQYNPDKRHITRAECIALNNFASSIASQN